MTYRHYLFFVVFLNWCFLAPAFADDYYYSDDPSPAYSDSDDIEDSGVDRQKIYHIYSNTDLIPTTKIAYDKPRIVVRATLPMLASDSEDNENVEAFNDLINEVMKDEMAKFKSYVRDVRDQSTTSPSTNAKNDLTIDFDTSVVNTVDKPIISIRFNIQGVIAGKSHPYHYHRVLNFNLHDGQKIELSDLFQPDSNYLQFLMNYSRAVLDKKLRAKTMILSGTAAKTENYKNWNLNPSGLLITFDEYQVAPYIYGTQTVLIPYPSIKNLIIPDSPIGKCLKHSSRCLRNHVLTGGFMDEA